VKNFKNMKKYKYNLKTLSPIILSPRSSKAFYRFLDYEEKDYEYNIIYPFYQYGEYDTFDAKTINRYIPGSSIKGALTSGLNDERNSLDFFIDDILIGKSNYLEVISLNKSQYFNLSENSNVIPKIKPFFDGTVGFESLKAGIELEGELRFAGDISEILNKNSAKDRCQNDIIRLEKYKENIKKPKDYNSNKDSQEAYDTLISQISEIKKYIELFCEDNSDIILLGGYKGLVRSLNNSKDLEGAIFATANNVPFGFVKIVKIEEVNDNEKCI